MFDTSLFHFQWNTIGLLLLANFSDPNLLIHQICQTRGLYCETNKIDITCLIQRQLRVFYEPEIKFAFNGVWSLSGCQCQVLLRMRITENSEISLLVWLSLLRRSGNVSIHSTKVLNFKVKKLILQRCETKFWYLFRQSFFYRFRVIRFYWFYRI